MPISQKVVIIKKKTRLENLVARFNTVEQARFYVEHLGADFSDYLLEHNEYIGALKECSNTLADTCRVQFVDREFLPNFIFNPDDIVIALGQDGLVANTLKYLSNQILIGVNPSPSRWDGALLPFVTKDLALLIPSIFQKNFSTKEVTLAKVSLNDGQSLLAVNDLFIGKKNHTSARYAITVGDQEEMHSSSGIIISTGLGSTGWLSSIITGATKVYTSLNPTMESVHNNYSIPWDADYLFYSVREPFPSNTTHTNLVFGQIKPSTVFKVTSFMPENGVIFSDGIENDFLAFNSGISAEIALAERKGILVV